MKIWAILRDPLVTLQIIPDRTARNYQVDILARALHETFTTPLARFSYGRYYLRYRSQEHFIFDLTMEAGRICFWLTVPRRWQEYAISKLQGIWPRATIKLCQVPQISPDVAARLTLKRHDLFSLNTAKNENHPLTSILEAAKDFKDGDMALVQVLAIPKDRELWEHDAQQAYKLYRQGGDLKKKELKAFAVVNYIFEAIDAVLKEMRDFINDFVGGPMPEDKREEDDLELRGRQRLSEATIRKISEPVFGVDIRLAAKAGKERAGIIIKTMATACSELAGDNELVVNAVSGKGLSRFTDLINTRQPPRVRLSYSTLSASELGKFMQIAGAELQDAYPQIERVPLRETLLPSSVTRGGLLLGTRKYHGQEMPVYMPTSNLDELCLPHIVIGGMGSGKTKGFAANLAVEAVKAGYGAVTIDPAKGEIGDEVTAALLDNKVLRVRFGQDPLAIDWREALHSSRARNRLANELVTFMEAQSDDAGAQTVRFMRAAAKAAPTGRLSEMIRLLTDTVYLDKRLLHMEEEERLTWKQYRELTDARRAQIAMPVLNRLDTIMGDDYLAECMESKNGLDFVELLKEPRVIILDIPKAELGAEAVDILASLIVTKLDIAMVLRKSTHPVFVIQDEPHQYMRAGRIWKAAAVESRKWRFSYCWLFHSWEQIPRQVTEIIKSALPHYHVYTSSKETYRALAEEIAPFTIEEALATPRFYALNVIRAGGVTAPPFLAKMTPPPSERNKIAGISC